MMEILLRLYFEFFKIGLFAVGGGLATIPFLTRLGSSTGWFTYSELTRMIAVSESTPGPIGINMATYVGYEVAVQHGMSGMLGALVATLGEITPSLIVIMLIAGILKKFRENRYVNAAFSGMRPAVIGLIYAAVAGMILSCVIFLDEFLASGNIAELIGIGEAAIFGSVLFLNIKFDVHPIVWIILSAVAGILLRL